MARHGRAAGERIAALALACLTGCYTATGRTRPARDLPEHVEGSLSNGMQLDPAPAQEEPGPVVVANEDRSEPGEAPPIATCPNPAADRRAGEGALAGAGVVLQVWGTFCIVGGPITAFICIVGFPVYWPFAVGAVVLGTGIGAVVGHARAGVVPCPAELTPADPDAPATLAPSTAR